jgi:hypothetical protein
MVRAVALESMGEGMGSERNAEDTCLHRLLAIGELGDEVVIVIVLSL